MSSSEASATPAASPPAPAGLTMPPARALAYMPVSYTHLDVYKRQDLLNELLKKREAMG